MGKTLTRSESYELINEFSLEKNSCNLWRIKTILLNQSSGSEKESSYFLFLDQTTIQYWRKRCGYGYVEKLVNGQYGCCVALVWGKKISMLNNQLSEIVCQEILVAGWLVEEFFKVKDSLVGINRVWPRGPFFHRQLKAILGKEDGHKKRRFLNHCRSLKAIRSWYLSFAVRSIPNTVFASGFVNNLQDVLDETNSGRQRISRQSGFGRTYKTVNWRLIYKFFYAIRRKNTG